MACCRTIIVDQLSPPVPLHDGAGGHQAFPQEHHHRIEEVFRLAEQVGVAEDRPAASEQATDGGSGVVPAHGSRSEVGWPRMASSGLLRRAEVSLSGACIGDRGAMSARRILVP